MIVANKALEAKKELIKKTNELRNQAIESIADHLFKNIEKIVVANQKDLQDAKNKKLSDALVDRLKLDEMRIRQIVESVKNVATQDEVVGVKSLFLKRDDGLEIYKQSIPLGVIGMIFESRPNVVVDSAVLAIKSGNCIILKGGSEAKHSNKILSDIIREAISEIIPQNTIQLIDSRDEVSELLQQVEKVDLIIPRGGENLIKYVHENSKVPVIAHFKGLCHVYLDKDADLKQAKDIVINAKTHRTGVCNAMETLIVHKDIDREFLQSLIFELKRLGTEVRLDKQYIVSGFDQATQQDWETEYLDNILSVKLVDSIDEAIEHITKYGSQHTEAIVSTNPKAIEQFSLQVDASSIMINASTRFNDGGEFGLGAEIGISTTKLHAYGPMGAKELTTQRYLVIGSGHTRK